MDLLFKDDLYWEKLKLEAFTWIGTPYKHFRADKGIGADCALFIDAIFSSIGISKVVSYDYHDRFWFMFTDEEIILNGLIDKFSKNLESDIVLKQVKTIELIRGDILTFRIKSQITNHVAVYFDNLEILHSLRHFGVIISPLTEELIVQQTRKYRLYR